MLGCAGRINQRGGRDVQDEAQGGGFGAFVGVLILIAALVLLECLLVLLAWNGLDLRGAFGAGRMSIGQALGLIIILNMVGQSARSTD